ncbi:serine/threonine protein phosphatase PrpC [Saccharothrix tamanrassetensis]|uniref:Serine/threonine protein phosphatase PrpC n=1 Tax=Saccharothrix tamanrassetensis TaxID=1051531 RepID=A0A841CHD3_9PSEU|nr:hypothetical protein [Saccharothrix tamanrassetensis]MBB5957952.1 serine/threonine protein phosphatase PrpC [Saccharothrix tamanrassetensis]
MTVLDHVARPNLPTTGWATARGHRRVAADTAAARTSGDRFAIAVADGIGDTPKSAAAARLVADGAVDAAWRTGVTGVVTAVRRALDQGTADHPTRPITGNPEDSTTVVPASRTPDDDPTLTLPADKTAEAADDTVVVTAGRTSRTALGDATFVVAAGDVAHGWSVTWVGDCRAYFVPLVPDTPAGPAPAVPLTSDHTIGQYLRQRGVQASPNLDRVVASTARKGDPGSAYAPPGAGRLVLVTNGVHHLLDAHAIGRIARTVTDPAEAAGALVTAALDAGGTDNAAAAIADLR